MLSRLKSIFRQHGYRLSERPYELNIVGIRSKNVNANRFDDEIHVFYRLPDNKWNYHVFRATTDPGTFWLQQPLTPQGTAILAQGQYRNSYGLGLHKGKYIALVQKAPVTVIRDYNRDAILDFLNGYAERGLFSINIHKPSLQSGKLTIDRDSAGCQVFADVNEYDQFISLCEKHKALYGNSFTYTLLDFRALRRESIRRVLIGTVALTLGVIGYIQYNHE